MTLDALTIEIEELTPEQAAEIFEQQKARPANFANIVVYLRAKAIGQAFDVKVNPDPQQNEAHAKDIRKWFGVAARERTMFVGKGNETREIPAPVSIKWREQSHKEKIKVKDANGRMGETEVTIIDRLHGKVVDASNAGRRGASTDDSEQVDDIVAKMTYAAGSKTLELPDGRKAKLTRSGHWRAPKPAQTPPTTGDDSSNGTAASTDNAKVAVGAA